MSLIAFPSAPPANSVKFLGAGHDGELDALLEVAGGLVSWEGPGPVPLQRPRWF